MLVILTQLFKNYYYICSGIDGKHPEFSQAPVREILVVPKKMNRGTSIACKVFCVLPVYIVLIQWFLCNNLGTIDRVSRNTDLVSVDVTNGDKKFTKLGYVIRLSFTFTGLQVYKLFKYISCYKFHCTWIHGELTTYVALQYEWGFIERLSFNFLNRGICMYTLYNFADDQCCTCTYTI